MNPPPQKRFQGRGSSVNPANRFQPIRLCDEEAQLEDASEPVGEPTQFFWDDSRSLITSNDSPDIPFRYSINPYRGCEHGCAYCYARPGHELLGFSAGIDFESQILAKRDADRLLRKELNAPSWRGEPIALSGVTDCYQPVERKLRLTRSIMEVFCEASQPFSVITKNALVTRDTDLLSECADWQGTHVFISLTTLDAELARHMEPRTSTPAARLRAVSQLAEAGIPVGVMIAPVIPGLNDHELPSLLQSAAAAGARAAGFALLRLTPSVQPVFLEWLERTLPTRYQAVLGRIRDCHGGELDEGRFGRRMRGTGPYAANVSTTFRAFARQSGLAGRLPPLNQAKFRPPRAPGGQQSLF